MELNGKAAVVTGAGRGLGLAYAAELARAGAAVVVNDADAATAEAAAKQITDAGGRAVAHPAAVGPAETADALVGRAVAEFGQLDVMVTNAGVLRDRVLWKMTDDDFDTVVQVHLKGTFTCARAAARRFREQGDGDGSSWSAPRPGSAATSGRRTTRRPRPGSSGSSAPGRWSWPARTSPSTRSSRSRRPR